MRRIMARQSGELAMQRPETTEKAQDDGTTWRMLVTGLVLGGFALSIWF